MPFLRTRRHALSTHVGAALCILTAVSVHWSYAQVAVNAGQSTSDLIEALDSDDVMTRAAAACELGEREAAEAVPALIELLADDASIAPFTCSSRWDRNDFNSPGREAAHALIDIGLQVADDVFRVLNHTLGSVREKAVWILGALEYSPAVEEIQASLAEDDYFLARANAAWALGAMDESESTPPLTVALNDEHARVREQAAWALGALDAQDAVEELSRVLLNDRSAEVRSQAAWALGAIGDAQGVTALVGALSDQEENVREQAAWALGAIGDDEAVDGLVGALQDEDAHVRSQSAWSLGAIGDSRAAAGLTAALSDDDEDVRKQAIWALGVLE